MEEISLDDAIRLDGLWCAITCVLQTVIPRPGYLEALGVTNYDRKLIDRMIEECWRDFETFEEFKSRTLHSNSRDEQAMYTVWVPMWEKDIAEAIKQVPKKVF